MQRLAAKVRALQFTAVSSRRNALHRRAVEVEGLQAAAVGPIRNEAHDHFADGAVELPSASYAEQQNVSHLCR